MHIILNEKCDYFSLLLVEPIKGQAEEEVDESSKDGSEERQPIRGFGPRWTRMVKHIHLADPTQSIQGFDDDDKDDRLNHYFLLVERSNIFK